MRLLIENESRHAAQKSAAVAVKHVAHKALEFAENVSLNWTYSAAWSSLSVLAES